MADAFYGRVPGAALTNVTGLGEVYTLPCDVELNVTFKFGNVSYHVHPLDTSMDLANTDSLGNPVCIGSFQPIQDGAQSSTYDMILGMAFCESILLVCAPAESESRHTPRISAQRIHADQFWRLCGRRRE